MLTGCELDMLTGCELDMLPCSLENINGSILRKAA